MTATLGTAATVSRPSKSKKSTISLLVVGILLIGSVVAIFLPLDRQAIGLIAFVMMFLLVLLRVSIALAMITSSFVGLYALLGERVVQGSLETMAYREVASWSLSVIPMFIFMGVLLWKAGVTTALYESGKRWLGWLPGGLAVGTNVAGTGLAAVSGSTIGTTYALARIGIPEMLKAGYHRRFAVGAVLVAGLPGQLIPPSILLVIYAGAAEVPIGPQLLAGLGVGIVVSLLFSATLIVMARFGGGLAGRERRARKSLYSWRDRFVSLTRVWPVPVIIGIVIVGMYSGVFTATEAGAAGATAAVLVALVLGRKNIATGFKNVRESAVATVSSTGSIFFILVGVAALSQMLSLTGISNAFADMVISANLDRVGFLFVMLVVYLLLGTVMEGLPMILLTVPVLIPTLHSLDISLLWFGVFAVFMAEIAIISPPIGILPMVIHTVAKDPAVNLGQKITLPDIFMSVLWFLPSAIILVVLLIFFPEIATFIPDLAATSP